MHRGRALGHLVSAETRLKISSAKKGKRASIQTEFKAGKRPSILTEFKSGQTSIRGRRAAIEGYSFIDATTGYRVIRDPQNPSHWRREHIVKAEKKLGRRLGPSEGVHHINGDKLDNRDNNLAVLTNSQHRKLHHLMSQLYQREHFAGANEELIDNLAEIQRLLIENRIGTLTAEANVR
jgi:hypothetical protein